MEIERECRTQTSTLVMQCIEWFSRCMWSMGRSNVLFVCNRFNHLIMVWLSNVYIYVWRCRIVFSMGFRSKRNAWNSKHPLLIFTGTVQSNSNYYYPRYWYHTKKCIAHFRIHGIEFQGSFLADWNLNASENFRMTMMMEQIPILRAINGTVYGLNRFNFSHTLNCMRFRFISSLRDVSWTFGNFMRSMCYVHNTIVQPVAFDMRAIERLS